MSETNLFGFEPITSIGYSNHEIISNTITLYGIERFDSDRTYFSGKFWKDLPKPIRKLDINPISNDVIRASSDDLPFESSPINTIMFDPSFILGEKDSTRTNVNEVRAIAFRFGAYANFDGLKIHYHGMPKVFIFFTLAKPILTRTEMKKQNLFTPPQTGVHIKKQELAKRLTRLGLFFNFQVHLLSIWLNRYVAIGFAILSIDDYAYHRSLLSVFWQPYDNRLWVGVFFINFRFDF